MTENDENNNNNNYQETPVSVTIVQPTARTTKTYFTNYFLTINSNWVVVDPNTPDSEQKRKHFHETCQKHLQNMGKYIMVWSTVDNEPVIKKVHIEAAIEIGPKTNMYHIHAIIKIEKFKKVKINIQYSLFTQDLNKLMGYTVHVDFKPFTDTMKNIEEYLNKYVVTF